MAYIGLWHSALPPDHASSSNEQLSSFQVSSAWLKVNGVPDEGIVLQRMKAKGYFLVVGDSVLPLKFEAKSSRLPSNTQSRSSTLATQ